MTTRISEEELQKQREYAEKIRSEALTSGQSPLLAHVRTYGCRANVADGERIKGMLAEMGFGFSPVPENADLILFNTCAVRENAETRVFGNIGALIHQKRRNPDLIVAVCGCMVQQPKTADKLYKTFPFVDLIFGTHAFYKFPELLYAAITSKKRIKDITKSDGAIAEGLPVKRESEIRADIPIMYGCDNFCSYCVVPYVRGRERSRLPADILAEANALIKSGVKEIMFLGQNVNSYRRDSGARGTGFAELLREAESIDGEFIITYMTSHPKDLTRELIDVIAASDKITRQLHLPVQSGSDRVLKLMNRGYTTRQYENIIGYAREKIPELSLTTDIIVGFPGETKEDFEQTLTLIRKIGFDSAFTFIYSKREGTKAAEMEDAVSEAEKSAWFRELLDVLSETGGEAYKRYVGKTLRVLCDGAGRSGERAYTGKSREGIIVDFDIPENYKADMTGKFADIKIDKALKWALLGKMAGSDDIGKTTALNKSNE